MKLLAAWITWGQGNGGRHDAAGTVAGAQSLAGANWGALIGISVTWPKRGVLTDAR
jgi:hypothetical protein